MSDPASAPVDRFVPSETEVFSWIETVVAQGIRRPGHPADEWCESWIAGQLTELGLDDVRLEPVDLPIWEHRGASLTAWPSSDPAASIHLDAFALPHTQPTTGFEAELVPYGEADVAGRIALEQAGLAELPQSIARLLATGVHDPSGELDTLVQTLPFGARINGEVLDPVIEAGAAGYVGALSGMPWETHDYYVPYDGVDRPLPAVWISAAAGRRLDALMAGGPVTARVVVDASRRAGRSHNVVGTLPGASDEWVVIGSHHDAPWASAVEDGSGIALVLAQAAYWSRIEPQDRPHNLLFLLNGGHMAGGAGTIAFTEPHRDLLDVTVLAVHLEHAACECRPEGDRLVPTGEPEVRWWFTTREPQLEATVLDALAAEDLHRSLVLPPDAFFEHPPTDGGFFHTLGVPLVNYLTAPMYLFDSCDTLDKVHRPSLVPVTRAAIRIIASTAGRTAADLRSGTGVAGERAGPDR